MDDIDGRPLQVGEEWRDVIGFPCYEVSNFGRVWAKLKISYQAKHKSGKTWPHQLKSRLLQLGRKRSRGRTVALIVSLSRNKAALTQKVHHLVLNAFVGQCPEGMECCHNDGDATNNRVENLRWDTKCSNRRDAICHDAAGLNQVDVANIRAWPWVSGINRALALLYEVHDSTISRLRSGARRNEHEYRDYRNPVGSGARQIGRLLVNRGEKSCSKPK